MWQYLKQYKNTLKKILVTAGSVMVTAVFGCGKILQSVGQALYSAGLDDEGLNLSAAANTAMAYTAMGGNFIVAIFSRIPKMYNNSKSLLACQKTQKNLVQVEAVQSLTSARKAVYKISFFYFICSGFFSLIFTTLNAIQSGVVLVRKIIGKPADSTLPPTWPEYVGATYVPVCTLLSYASFNMTRIVTNSRQASLAVARIGTSVEPFTRREKISLLAAGGLAILFTIGNAVFSIISTENSLLLINKLFFNLPMNNMTCMVIKIIGLVSAIPGLASVLLTAGADLYKIFTGELRLFDLIQLQSSYLKFSFWLLLVISSIADSVMSNGAGFFGSMLSVLNRWFNLAKDGALARGISGVFAITSILPYFANNGAQAFQVLSLSEPAARPAALSPVIGEETSLIQPLKKESRDSVVAREGFWAHRRHSLALTVDERQEDVAVDLTYGTTVSPRTPRQSPP